MRTRSRSPWRSRAETCDRWGRLPTARSRSGSLIKKLGAAAQLRVCDEAGPTGYVIYWPLTGLGVRCEVVAPTLVPVKAGDRVKTDRRDATKLARSDRAGDLTPVWVPDAAHEALRDVVRAREAAKKDQLRARHRLGKFLLRHGRRPATTPWTQRHLTSVRQVKFEQPAQEATRLDYLHEVDHVADRIERLERAIDDAVKTAPPCMRAVIEALQALRGIALVSAVTIVAEVGELSRFRRAPHVMGHCGMGAREDSSGTHTRRGGITKTGNAHLRRIAIEAAWAYRHRPTVGGTLRKRQAALSEDVKAIGWESATPAARARSQAAGTWQVSAARGDGGGTRALGLHLGDRRHRGACTPEHIASNCGVTDQSMETGRQHRWRPRGTRKGEPSSGLCGGPPGRTRAVSPR
jgi:transposase